MLQFVCACDFVITDAPIDFTFFTNGATIGVDEGMGTSREESMEVMLGVDISFDNSHPWKPCQFLRVWRVGTSSYEANVVGAILS